MDKLYSFVANSSVMAVFCGLAILVVLVQAVLFSGPPGNRHYSWASPNLIL